MSKSVLALLFAALLAVAVSGFAVTAPSFRHATALDGSRARDKTISRTKWLQKRGYAVEGIAQKEETADEESAEDGEAEAEESTEAEDKAEETAAKDEETAPAEEPAAAAAPEK